MSKLLRIFWARMFRSIQFATRLGIIEAHNKVYLSILSSFGISIVWGTRLLKETAAARCMSRCVRLFLGTHNIYEYTYIYILKVNLLHGLIGAGPVYSFCLQQQENMFFCCCCCDFVFMANFLKAVRWFNVLYLKTALIKCILKNVYEYSYTAV